MKARIRAVRSFTLVKFPRRIALRVIMEKASARFIHAHPAGVTCSRISEFSSRASQFRVFSCLCVR